MNDKLKPVRIRDLPSRILRWRLGGHGLPSMAGVCPALTGWVVELGG